MIDHGLEIVAYALKVRQTYLLPIGAAPESQSAQAEAWSAAAAYGALAHDIGKIVVDLQVELQDGSTWHPWNGPITIFTILLRPELVRLSLNSIAGRALM